MREDEICHLIRLISNKMRAKGDANLKERGLTFSQMQVLIALYRHEGTMTQKQLEQELNVAHPTMVGLLQRLENNGYVEFGSDENDKRIKVVRQTEKALELKEETRQKVHKMSVKMFSHLSDEEKESLYGMLNRISEDLNEESREII